MTATTTPPTTQQQQTQTAPARIDDLMRPRCSEHIATVYQLQRRTVGSAVNGWLDLQTNSVRVGPARFWGHRDRDGAEREKEARESAKLRPGDEYRIVVYVVTVDVTPIDDAGDLATAGSAAAALAAAGGEGGEA